MSSQNGEGKVVGGIHLYEDVDHPAQDVQVGGYSDLEFVEPLPDDLLCLICTFVAKEPYQVSCCGKIFCKICLKQLGDHGSANCPQCRVGFNSFSDKKSARHINTLRVKCKYAQNGCQWASELNLFNAHVATCDWFFIDCPNKCMAGNHVVQVLHKFIQKHLTSECPCRQYECPHCKEKGEYQERTTAHLEECPYVKVPCPNNGCNTHHLRGKLPAHRAACQHEVVKCKYVPIGCKEKFPRKSMSTHEGNQNRHLHLALDMVVELKRQMEDILLDMPSKQEFTFKLTKFESLKSSNEPFCSPYYYTHTGGYKMFCQIYANGYADGKDDHVSVFHYLMKGEHDDLLQWPFMGTVIIKLLNQLDDKRHHAVDTEFTADNTSSRRVLTEEKGLGFGRPKFIPHTSLDCDSTKNCQYLKDDCLYFQVRVNFKTAPKTKPWLKCTVSH